MTKKTTGEFPMTWDERRAWMDATVALRLAAHYEGEAKEYRKMAERKQVEFWDIVKQRPRPKKHLIEIIDERMIKISVKRD